MRRPPTLRAVLAVAIAAVAVAAALRGERPPAHVAVGGAAGGVASLDAPPPADPFPIRRVWVPPDQIPVPTGDQPGAWRTLPRDEFERRVRAAAATRAALLTPPILVRAEYKAAYEPGRLFGSVEWAVANPGRRPAALPFDPLKIAIDNPKWGNGADALLFHGKLARSERPGAHLWVDAADGGSVSANWSVRGVADADAETFTLSAPSAAIATVEITLPADLRLSSDTPGVVLSGPTADRRWQVSFGGRAEVLLVVRKATAGRPPPPVDRTARYEVTAGAVRAAFVFPHAPHADQRDWLFDVDPGLAVDRVSGEGCGGWTAEPGGKVRVRLQPLSAAARLTIAATARLGAELLTLPGIRPAEGVAADLIDLTLSPDWKFDGWSAPDYRVSVPGEPADRTYRVQFAGGVITTGEPARRRPVVRLRRGDAEYATDEAVSWAVSPGTTRLTARIKVKVTRGPLTALPVETEPGYVLEKVSVVPDDPTVEFGRLPGVAGGWLVEPTRGIGGGQTAEFRLEFRADNRVRAGDPADAAPTPTVEPLPRFALPAAADRQGTLAVTAGGGLRAAVRTAGGGTDADVPYRGREPVGEVRLTPERVTAAITGYHLSVDGRGWVVRVTGRADDSGLSDLSVALPDPAGTVRADGAAATPLPAPAQLALLTANSGWAAVAAAGAAVEPGGYWRVAFARPVRGEFALTVHLPAGRVPAGPERVDVPLPRVCGVPDEAAGVALAPALAATHRVEGAASPDADPRAAFPTLHLSPRRVDAAPPAREWRYDDLRRTGTVHPDGSVGVVLTGRIVQSAAGVLTVRLPTAATLGGLTVGGRWVTPTPAGGGYHCPLPEIDATGLPVEVRYRLPAAGGGVYSSHHTPAPELPGDPPAAHRWEVSAGLCAWPAAGAADAVWVFSEFVPIGLGLLFAGLVVASGWATRCGGRGRGVLAGQVVVWAVASRLVPDGWEAAWQFPLTCGLLGLAAGALAGRTTPAGRPARGGTAAATLAALAGLAGSGPARTQGTEPVTVYLSGDPDRLVVYAAQATLDRLDAEAAPPLAAAVITRGRYTGSVVNDVARFEAVYTVRCPGRGPHEVLLPLAGARLERVTLDGAEVFPAVPRADRYTVAVSGPGRHELAVRFAVVPTDLRGGRAARFGVPEVPWATVSFTAGAAGDRPDVASRQGGQVTTPGPAVDADHGGGRAVEVRWRAASPPAGPPSVRVKEGAVWDVAADAPAVTAAFVYQIDGGPRDRFRWAIPAGLVPVSVQLRAGEERAEPLAAEPWAVQPAAGGAVVEVKLKAAAEGRVTAVLRLVPAAPLAATPVLHFPAAADVPDADRDSVYAVRFGGVAPAGMAIGSAIDFPPDAVTKDFAWAGELNLDKAPPARVLKRTAGGQTELRPDLRPLPGWAGVTAEATYTLGRWHTADGGFRVTGREVGAFEFDLPPAVDLRDVRAADLKGWSRSGSRVQVWLTRPTADLTVRWTGQFAAADGRADLPLPQPAVPGGWGAAPLTVRVRPAAGWVARPVAVSGMTARGAGGTAESVYSADRGAAAAFQVQPVAPTPKAGEPVRRPPPPAADDTRNRPAPPPAADPADEPPAGWPGWPADAAWLVGVALVVGLFVRASRRWAPECLTGVGAVGLIGTAPAAAVLFAPLVLAGLGWRAARWVRSRG